MPLLNEQKFSLVSKAFDEDTFTVVRFTGEEGLSRPYRFDIDLVSEADVDFDQMLEQPATLTIQRSEGSIPFHGILAEFEMLHAYGQYVFYRAVLVPRLWWLSLTSHNRIFLDKTLPEILDEVLQDGGLTSADFEIKLKGEYPAKEYVCQYGESHFNFVSRWMERDGIHYYFDQTGAGEKLIITDTSMAHTFMPQGRSLTYSPPSGLETEHWEETVTGFSCRQRLLPKKVLMKDYNYRRPSLDLTGNAPITDRGRGDVYIYGDHFRSPEEGNHLAAIRAEELICRQREFTGQSRIPFIRPGYTFDLTEHYRDDYNQTYLTVSLEHQGSQAAWLTSVLNIAPEDREEQSFYSNRFTAIEAGRQYRPPRLTPKAHCYGTVNAAIDAAGSGRYAELDDMGRYKVILPFDRSGRKDGKASAFLRMMQPYTGSDHGMHFPLHKGTEVLLVFIDGDPDRPVIAGAVPNPDNPSPVASGQSTMNMITSSGENRIHMEDQAGSQRILLHSPTADSFVRIGARNDPAAQKNWGEDWDYHYNEHNKDGIALVTGQGLDIQAGTVNKVVVGESISAFIGLNAKVVVGERIDTTLGHRLNVALLAQTDYQKGWHWNWRNTMQEMKGTHQRVRGQQLTVEEAADFIEGEVERLQGGLTDVVGNADEAVAQVNTAVGNAERIEGQLGTAATNANEAKADLTRVVGRATVLKGELNDASADAYRVRGQLNRLIGKGTELGTQMEQAAANINRVAGEISRIHGGDTTV
jgi:type VI secretion system secreted protein VgrG